MSKIFVIFLGLFSSAFSMPFELVENGKIIKTDKCNATDFADFVQKLNDCNHAAESIVDEAILKGTNVSKAICQSFTEKYGCFVSIGPECYDEERQVDKEVEILFQSFAKVFNSSFLGEQFEKECDILSKNEERVVKYLTGSTSCGAREFKEAKTQQKQCGSEATKSMLAATELIPFVSDKINMLKRKECAYYNAVFECDLAYTKCLSPTKIGKVTASDLRFFEKRQNYIADFNPGLDFEYDQNCDMSVVQLLRQLSGVDSDSQDREFDDEDEYEDEEEDETTTISYVGITNQEEKDILPRKVD